MRSMFHGASQFNSDVGQCNVTNMSEMFSGCFHIIQFYKLLVVNLFPALTFFLRREYLLLISLARCDGEIQSY